MGLNDSSYQDWQVLYGGQGTNPFTGAPGQPQIGEGQHYIGQIEEVMLPSGRLVLQTWVADVDVYGRPTGGMHAEYQTSYNDTTGGGAGATWRPGEYGLEQQNQEMLQRHYYISDSIDRLTEDRAKMEGEWANAIAQGNLALARQTEQRIAANEAQSLALKQEQQRIDAALGQAQVGASVYGTQTQGRSSQLGTLATLTQAAGEAQANPWNPMGYLTNVASGGGATPFSNMTPGQNTAYGNQMAQNWQNTYGNVYDTLNQSIAQTYQTPQSILDALQRAQPQPVVAQTPMQIALARYGASTEGERKALAAASPEALKRLWEAGQVR